MNAVRKSLYKHYEFVQFNIWLIFVLLSAFCCSYALAAYDAPRNRHIIRIQGNDIRCLTCNLTRNCSYYDDVRFSHGVNPDYIVVTCRGPRVPFTQVWQLSDLLTGSADLQEVHEVRSNKKVQNQVDRKAIPHRKYLEVELTSLKNGPSKYQQLTFSTPLQIL